MPTATSAFGFTITNYGPLTTTFVAAPSCATESSWLQIAPSQDPAGVLFSVGCDITKSTFGQCYPSGSTVDFHRSRAATDVGFREIGYYSPGLICPAGWKTVGLAAKARDGALSTSGVFSPAVPVTPGVVFNPPLNVLLGAIDPGETAVLCCPSSMTGGEGTCYSTLPNVKPTEGCLIGYPNDDFGTVTTTISIYGTTVSANLVTVTGTKPPSDTLTSKFPDAEASQYVVVTFTPMVALVHTATTDAPVSSTSSSAASSRTISKGGITTWPVQICAVAMTLGFIFSFSL